MSWRPANRGRGGGRGGGRPRSVRQSKLDQIHQSATSIESIIEELERHPTALKNTSMNKKHFSKLAAVYCTSLERYVHVMQSDVTRVLEPSVVRNLLMRHAILSLDTVLTTELLHHDLFGTKLGPGAGKSHGKHYSLLHHLTYGPTRGWQPSDFEAWRKMVDCLVEFHSDVTARNDHNETPAESVLINRNSDRATALGMAEYIHSLTSVTVIAERANRLMTGITSDIDALLDVVPEEHRIAVLRPFLSKVCLHVRDSVVIGKAVMPGRPSPDTELAQTVQFLTEFHRRLPDIVSSVIEESLPTPPVPPTSISAVETYAFAASRYYLAVRALGPIVGFQMEWKDVTQLIEVLLQPIMCFERTVGVGILMNTFIQSIANGPPDQSYIDKIVALRDHIVEQTDMRLGSSGRRIDEAVACAAVSSVDIPSMVAAMESDMTRVSALKQVLDKASDLDEASHEVLLGLLGWKETRSVGDALGRLDVDVSGFLDEMAVPGRLAGLVEANGWGVSHMSMGHAIRIFDVMARHGKTSGWGRRLSRGRTPHHSKHQNRGQQQR